MKSTLFFKIRNSFLKHQNFVVERISFRMNYVEGGSFEMGGDRPTERPRHRVNVDSFYIGETVVTQALWKAVMGEQAPDYCGDQFPVHLVSWDNCQEFIRRLNELTGKTFRLPTEAEWEYAARSGKYHKKYRYDRYSGTSDVEKIMNGERCVVKHFIPNRLGLYDMTGCIWQWVNDYYGPYELQDQSNPQGVDCGDARVTRGGCYNSEELASVLCTVSSRNNYPQEMGVPGLGFRLAMSM